MIASAFTAASAHATHDSHPPCMVVTQSTVLRGDLGPCGGHGIVIAADDVTLDLGGFTVTGHRTATEQAGVLLDNVSGVTVRNGTVTNFDSGVVIEGGGGNTVSAITASGNVNDTMEPVDPATASTPHDIDLVTCVYGHGITASGSDDNIIERNVVTENGPLAGIALVGDSDGNVLRRNAVHENDLINKGVVDHAGNPVWAVRDRHVPAGTPGAIRPNSMCGATGIGTPAMSRGRHVEGIGIRVEGPGADANLVERNTVTKSGLAGISFHSYLAFPASSSVPREEPSTNNVVSRNDVSLTGVDTVAIDPVADGISSLSSERPGTVPSHGNTIEKNASVDNMRHGISLQTRTATTTVDKNDVHNNRGSGLLVAEGATHNVLTANQGSGNAHFDGWDGNAECDNNRWSHNRFATVNRPCVAGARRGAR